jgi:hypothetical protein
MSANFEFKNSAQKDKEVSPNQIEFGEIALNYHQTGPFLQCKDTSGRVWRIGGIIVDENAPASPAIGAWWHKPSNQHTSFFNGSNWIRVSQGSIVDSDIALGANIGVSKLAPGAPGQLIQTHPSGTLVEWVSSLDLPGTLTVNSDTVLNADTVIHGDLTVDGTVTTINTVDLSIKDKNIELGVVPTPSDAAADTGGITLKGTTDKTFNWINLTQSWTSSENLNLAFSKTYKISGIDVLSGTSLGSGVVNSSLTSVGTIGTGVWQGSAIGAAYGGTGQTSYSAGQLLIGKTDGTLGKSTLTAGSNITITNGNGTIQIAATDTNTTYTAGDGLDLTGTVFSVDLKAGSGLVIESGEIALDADLTAIAGLTGTSGFLKKTAANTWSLDTNTYLTGNQNITISGDAAGSGTTSIALTLANSGVTADTYNNSSTAITPLTVDAKGRITATGTAVTVTPAFSSITGKPTTLTGYGITDAQPLDADLTAIAGLAGTSGFLKKTAANTWSLDTNTYLTGNQSISITGDATGSGATSITLTLANSGVAAGTYNNSSTALTPFTVDAKGRITGVGSSTTITPAFASITGKPTTLAGYGITDGVSTSGDQSIAGNKSFTGITTLAGTAVGSWSASNTDIDGLIGGSTFGSLFEGVSNGHFTIGLRSNDAGDGFQVISKQAGNATYTLKCFEVRADGNASIAGTLTAASFSGNATTATSLATARTINGVPFDGTLDITIPTTLASAVTFNNGGAGAASGSTFNGSAALTVSYNTIGAPSTTGTNASGTWGISITGNAGTATTATSATTATNCSRQVIAGNGLSGGGALSADVTLTVGAGDGISVAATSVAVNSTVIRTTGDQTLGGNKTFSSPLLAAAGSITAPGIASSGDTNTGLWWESGDKLTVVAGGARAAYFTGGEQLNYGNIYITTADDVAADATTTTRGSGTLFFRGKYWNGTTSVNTDWNAFYIPTDTAGNGEWRLRNGSTTRLTVNNSGTVTATTFSGSGASLTSLNASNLSSGTIPDARISGAYTGITAINGSGIGGTSGDWWTKIPLVSGGGAMEIGRYIDFHSTATGTTDYDVRIDCTGANALSIGATVTATGFSGSGASLTSLNASNLTSGTVPDARISGSYTGLVNLSGTGTCEFASFNGTHSGGGAGLTALNASNLSSGTVPDARISGAYTGITAINGWGIGGTSGDWWIKIPVISGGGVLEIGRYIDFHNSATGTTDYDVRIDCTGANALSIGATVTATGFSGSGASLTSLNASNISSGTIGDAYLPATISSSITGNAATATTASACSGNAASATLVSTVTNATGTGTFYIPMVNSNVAGNRQLQINTAGFGALAYNAATSTILGNISGESGSCIGNSATATRLSSSRTFQLTGDLSGSVNADLSTGFTISASVSDNSHNHDTSTLTNVTSGSYTPTLTNTANISASNVGSGNFQYQRVGNIVSVCGTVSLTPSSSTANFELRITLPIAPATFANTTQAHGVAGDDGNTINGRVVSVGSTTVVAFIGRSTTTGTSRSCGLSFSYRI